LSDSEPLTTEENTETSGQSAPDFGISGEAEESGAGADNLVRFPAAEKGAKRGRPKKTGDEPRVSVEQVSKHTFAVRLRWMREDGVEDGVVVNRLRDDVVKEIKRSKKRYEQFKAQTIASWKSRAIRKGDDPRTDTVGVV
jgi:hypothetical protein